ncbi:unnamed protein product [Lactuca saligna]|uniref:Uncharacterized protein n=1 Tax=Lactuca saligna TaxID=75948 RepID=A0AA35ZRJ3_LACSI|nr:unnamed protein product [Lactuca saligna]
MGPELFKKYASSSMKIFYRSLLRHPFLVGMVFILIWMHRLFPSFFSFLLSSSPVIVSTAVLLGTLLSFGQPNIPEIEKEPKSEQYEIQKLESKVMSQTETVERDGNFASEATNISRIEVGEKSFEVFNSVNDDNSCVEVNKPLYLVDDGEFVTEENCENSQFEEDQLVDEAKNEIDEVKVVLGSHYSPLKQSEDEHIVLESDDKLWEGSADPLNSDPALLWKRVEGDGYDEDEDDDDDDDDDDEGDDDDDDDDDDSGSDLAESSSPDASMADIIPMLDELHPLLSEEQEIRQEHNDDEDGMINHEDSEHSLESSESSSESNDEDVNEDHKDEQVGEEDEDDEEEEEDKESKHTDKEDEPRSAITWTEDDQKNLMNLGTSEMERNRRLENLIARRRARKTMRMQAENNLIDLESADLPWSIPPISTTRSNPFDYDSQDNIPGSAPSVLLKRRNPFDLPYDPNEEKPDLVGDTFQQEFAGFQPKEPFFRRHESFNVGPSNFGALRSERQETKLRPYFVPERTFQRQFSGISDSKVSSVPDTESVSSAGDLENKDHEDEQSLEQELVSEKDQEHEHEELISESHERPYFVPEHVASLAYERQLSGVSDSKLSSIPDTESVSSASDLENKDHIEDDHHSLEPELVSEKDQEHEHEELISESHERPYFVPEHVASLAYERQSSGVSDSKLSSISDTDSVSSADDLENKDHIDLSQEPELISFEDDIDGNVESVQVTEGDERLHEDEISVGNVMNQEEVVNVVSIMAEAVHSSRASSLSSSDEVSEQVYNEKDGDEVASSVSETSSYFEEHGSLIERSEIDVTSLSVEESHPKEPVYDTSPRSVTRNLSSSSISNDLQAISERHASFSGQDSQETAPKTETDCHGNDVELIDSSAADEVGSRSITNRDLNDLELNLEPSVVDDHLHKDESFQHTDDQHQSSSSADVLLDMDASHQPEQVEVSSSNFNEKSHENTQQEEVISQPEEDDPEELQVQEPKQGEVTSSNGETYGNPNPTHHQFVSEEEEEAIPQPQEEVPLLDTTANKQSEENTELVQVQITSNNLDNLQIEEPQNDISRSIDSVLNAKFDVVETEEPGKRVDPDVPDNIEDVDEIHEMDETFLVELDAVGDFSVNNDLVSTSNEMKHDPHAFETKLSADEDSYSKDLGSVLNVMEQPAHALEHDLETKHSGDEHSYPKDQESSLNEKKEDSHDLETKCSADEDSYSKDLGLEQNPHSLERDLETNKHSEDLGATLDEMKQNPHDLETKLSGDEVLGSTLKEMKQDPDASEHDIETKHSGDEDSYSKDLGLSLDDLETKLSEDEESYSEAIGSTLNEMRVQKPEASGHALETFYSVDEYAFSKFVESALNEMKQEPQALEHVLETNPSADEDLYPINLSKTKLNMDEEQVLESQNEKESSNIEVAGASEAEAFKTKLTNNNTNELLALPKETESNFASASMVNHGTENASSTSNTDKE